MGISTFDEATRPGGTGVVNEHKHRCLKCGEYLNCTEGRNGENAMKGTVWEICNRHDGQRRMADDFDWWWEQRKWYHP